MTADQTADQAAGGPGRLSPMDAWKRLQQGNERFVVGRPEHPGQDAAKRAELSAGQRPFAMVLGCSDSRVAAEIVFDQGLGDLFVVRTAGHVVDSSVLGSLEFGIAALGIPLIVVLGHDRCGAVAATVAALDDGRLPSGFLRDVVERVAPSVLAARRRLGPGSPAIGRGDDPVAPPDAAVTIEDIEAEHVRQTATLLTERSAVVGAAVRTSSCAIVPATYRLAEGRVEAVAAVG